MAVPAMPTQFQNGTVPITAEPLHQWEKQGLSELANPGLLGGGGMVQAQQMLKDALANPQAFTGQYTNPMATQYMGQAGTATAAGMAPITSAEVQGVANPFTDVLKDRLSEAGQKARAAILANQGVRGARSFGDTVQGMRETRLDKEMLMGGREIDYQGFKDAFSMLDNQRNRTMQAGGQYGNLAQGAQGITTDALRGGLSGIGALFDTGKVMTDTGFERIKNTMGAGKYVRDYNQIINDSIGNDMLAEQGNDANKVSQILNWLKSYESSTAGATPAANSLTTASGLGQLGGGLFDSFSKLRLSNDIDSSIANNPGIF